MTMKMRSIFLRWPLLAGCAVAVQAATFNESIESIKKDLDAGLRDLSAMREKIQAEQVPLTKELRQLEDELIAARKEYDGVLKIRDTRTLDVSNLKSEIKAREDQNKYLSNLLDEYLRNLETRLHIAEVQRYGKMLGEVRSTVDNNDFSLSQRFAARLQGARQTLDRVEDLLGGATFPGTAVDGSGLIVAGKFTQLGPLAYFVSEDGKALGMVEQQLGKNEPAIVPFVAGQEAELSKVVATGAGALPFDPTGGKARKVEATKETLAEHIIAGGLTMVPILGLAAAALCIGLMKWFQLARVRTATAREVRAILGNLNIGQVTEARQCAARIGGPVGEMLVSGIDHLHEPKALVEELLFEKVLYAKGKLNAWLPFIAVTASSAPLLGLLGTVTGMINTFKMITVFGTGDAQTLSGGISEALITTEWGLIVAIPSVLLYAFLSRKAKGILDDMEKIAVSFLNRLPSDDDRTTPDEDLAAVSSKKATTFSTPGAPSLALEPDPA
jgi:biopolymer transport protein ExbB